MDARRYRTRVSTKGQVVLPKAVRGRPGFEPGAELTVEATEQGVLFRPAPKLKSMTLDQLVGVAGYGGPPRSVDDMDRAINEEIQARHVGGRY